MDFRFAPEDEAFRLEVRDFIKKNWDDRGFAAHDLNVRAYDFDSLEARELDWAFTRKLVEKGWYAMAWPKEYGGMDAPYGKQVVYAEEMGYAGAPGGGGISNIAGAIMLHGSDFIKREFLPRMRRGEVH